MVPFDLRVNPWWSLTVSGPPRTLQRSLKVTRALRLFKLKTLHYGCLWIPFNLRVDAWWKLTVSGLLKVPGALCLFKLKTWKNGQNCLPWPQWTSCNQFDMSNRYSICHLVWRIFVSLVYLQGDAVNSPDTTTKCQHDSWNFEVWISLSFSIVNMKVGS